MTSFSNLSSLLRGAVLAAACLAAPSAFAAANLIADGDFSQPNQGGGWHIYASGVDGWTNTNGDGIEIGRSPIYGLACANAACQNLEVNANTFDTDQQTISGLTVGQTYDLSFLYGTRSSGGPDILDVSFGGKSLGSLTGTYTGDWVAYSWDVTATATSENLVFASEVTSGAPSYGNEITNVSLSAVPEPSTWAMMALGFAGLGFAGYRKARRAAAAA